MAERKFFDIYKNIPFVGRMYRYQRAMYYSIQGNSEETLNSLENDLADLNPLRTPRNMINSIRNIVNDLDEGIWIGKRSLADQPFSLTVLPGYDLYHWCIQIDGIIYEIVPKKPKKMKINIISNGSDLHKQYCSRFSWTRIPEKIRTSNSTLEDYARSFEDTNFNLLIINGNNCQSFAIRMLAKAANISFIDAQACIKLIMPNYLF